MEKLRKYYPFIINKIFYNWSYFNMILQLPVTGLVPLYSHYQITGLQNYTMFKTCWASKSCFLCKSPLMFCCLDLHGMSPLPLWTLPGTYILRLTSSLDYFLCQKFTFLSIILIYTHFQRHYLVLWICQIRVQASQVLQPVAPIDDGIFLSRSPITVGSLRSGHSFRIANSHKIF